MRLRCSGHRYSRREQTVYLPAADHPGEHAEDRADNRPAQHSSSRQFRPCNCDRDRDHCWTENDASDKECMINEHRD